jgi:hypothetical protein
VAGAKRRRRPAQASRWCLRSEAGLLLCLMMAIRLGVLWVLRPVLRPTPAPL